MAEKSISSTTQLEHKTPRPREGLPGHRASPGPGTGCGQDVLGIFQKDRSPGSLRPPELGEWAHGHSGPAFPVWPAGATCAGTALCPSGTVRAPLPGDWLSPQGPWVMGWAGASWWVAVCGLIGRSLPPGLPCSPAAVTPKRASGGSAPGTPRVVAFPMTGLRRPVTSNAAVAAVTATRLQGFGPPRTCCLLPGSSCTGDGHQCDCVPVLRAAWAVPSGWLLPSRRPGGGRSLAAS